jgi:hypothetical protein
LYFEGEFVFGGKMNTTVLDVLENENINLDYIYVNFNDFGFGFMTCFILLINNNWNILVLK